MAGLIQSTLYMDALITTDNDQTQVEKTNDQDYYEDIEVIFWLPTTIMEMQDKQVYTLFYGTRVHPLHRILRQGYPYNQYDPISGVLKKKVQGMV